MSPFTKWPVRWTGPRLLHHDGVGAHGCRTLSLLREQRPRHSGTNQLHPPFPSSQIGHFGRLIIFFKFFSSQYVLKAAVVVKEIWIYVKAMTYVTKTFLLVLMSKKYCPFVYSWTISICKDLFDTFHTSKLVTWNATAGLLSFQKLFVRNWLAY